MKIYSLAMGALVGALTTLGFSQMNSSPNAMQVQTLGAADQNAVAHFNVYLPLTHTDALEQLLRGADRREFVELSPLADTGAVQGTVWTKPLGCCQGDFGVAGLGLHGCG